MPPAVLVVVTNHGAIDNRPTTGVWFTEFSSLQERMSAEGATFVEQPPRSVHVETDGLLVTGQNPASAQATAEAFLAVLERAGA